MLEFILTYFSFQSLKLRVHSHVNYLQYCKFQSVWKYILNQIIFPYNSLLSDINKLGHIFGTYAWFLISDNILPLDWLLIIKYMKGYFGPQYLNILWRPCKKITDFTLPKGAEKWSVLATPWAEKAGGLIPVQAMQWDVS